MLKILLLEDDDDLRQTMRELLSKKYLVTAAENGKMGQYHLEKADFDLIICDAQMPQMGGIEFFKWTKATKPTPFILATGYSEMLETKAVFDLDIKNILIKPFMISDLNRAVQDALEEPLETTKSAS